MGSLPPYLFDDSVMEVDDSDDDVLIQEFSAPGSGTTHALRYLLEHELERTMNENSVFDVSNFPLDIVEDISNELLICINLGLDILDLINCMFIMLGVFFLIYLMTSKI